MPAFFCLMLGFVNSNPGIYSPATVRLLQQLPKASTSKIQIQLIQLVTLVQ